MNNPNTKERTLKPELMDDFSLRGKELADALAKIADINKFLGGNKLTLSGVRKLLRNKSVNKPIHILDVGCGNGDMLRVLAKYAASHGHSFKLTGVDANPYTINIARSLSNYYPEINYICRDILKEELNDEPYDIIICTLTLHHFSDPEIENLLDGFYSQVNLGIVINDLDRNALSYQLFKMVCVFFGLNSLSREDGLTSILRGFKRKDLNKFAIKMESASHTIRWKWAFRYKWVIQKHER